MMLETANRQFVSPLKEKLLSESRNSVKKIPCNHSWTFRDAVILPARRIQTGTEITGNHRSIEVGGVLDSNGAYREESLIPGWAEAGYSVQNPEEDGATAVYCGRMIGQWGHFLLESITRLWYFIGHDNNEYVYVFIVKENTNPEIEPTFQEFFQLLGMENRIRFLNKPVRYKKVIIPERSFQYRHFFSDEYIRIFDEVCEAAENRVKSQTEGHGYSKKIYLSRHRFMKAVQSESGLDMLEDYFSGNGYKILFPECQPLTETICAIREADAVASESGSCAHNFLFCREGQKVTVIERQAFINDAQASIDRVRRLNTTYVEAALTIAKIYHGKGPFLIAYTPYFRNYAEYLGELPPNDRYLSMEYLKTLEAEYHSMQKRIPKDHPGCNDSRAEELLEHSMKMTEDILKYGLHTHCEADKQL